MAPRMIPPVYFAASLMLMTVSHYFLPSPAVIFPPYTYSGFVLIAFGISMIVWAFLSFRKAGTTIDPHGRSIRLITSGPFRVSRNPIYLGMAAILSGAGTVFGSAFPFVFILVFMIAIENAFILAEENKLKNIFGRRYTAYKKKVRRWI